MTSIVPFISNAVFELADIKAMSDAYRPRIPSASKSAVVVPSGHSKLSRRSFRPGRCSQIFPVQKQPVSSRLGFTPQESDRMQPAAEYGRR